MSYLCDLVFIFIFIFTYIHFLHKYIYAYLLGYVLLFLDNNMDEQCEWFSNGKSSALGCCLIFA